MSISGVCLHVIGNGIEEVLEALVGGGIGEITSEDLKKDQYGVTSVAQCDLKLPNTERKHTLVPGCSSGDVATPFSTGAALTEAGSVMVVSRGND